MNNYAYMTQLLAHKGYLRSPLKAYVLRTVEKIPKWSKTTWTQAFDSPMFFLQRNYFVNIKEISLHLFTVLKQLIQLVNNYFNTVYSDVIEATTVITFQFWVLKSEIKRRGRLKACVSSPHLTVINVLYLYDVIIEKVVGNIKWQLLFLQN